MTKLQEKIFIFLNTPIAIGISIFLLVALRALNLFSGSCIAFILLLVAIVSYAHIRLAITDAGHSAILITYSLASLCAIAFIGFSNDERIISIVTISMIAVLAIAGVCSFVIIAIRSLTGKIPNKSSASSSAGFDYIPELERYKKEHKKRQRKRAADKVKSLSLFGNETFAIVYASIVIISLITAILHDIHLV